jgi:RNA polymerase-binding transcription factor DksA
MIPEIAPTAFNPSEREEFKTILLARRGALRKDVQSLECRQGQSDEVHAEDLGIGHVDQDVSLGRLAAESDEVREVEDALQRLHEGTFGVCDSCASLMTAERLIAIPYARLCLTCKRNEETENAGPQPRTG